MSRSERTTLARALVRAASVVLLLYPRRFRTRYGADMTEVFVDVCLVRSGGSPARRLARAGRTLLGMARSGLAERLGRRPEPHYRIPHDRHARSGVSLVNGILQDVRYAARSLRKQPAFTALVVGMLALGVAANATIFSALNSAVLRPMPFADPDRLVVLDEIAPQWGLESVSIAYPDFHYWNERNRTFESMAVYDTTMFNLSVDGRPDRVYGARVHWRLLHVLGLEPVVGRDFTAEDFEEGAPPVTLVSERFWHERLGGDTEALGSPVRFDSREFTVIGVYPDEAVLPANAVAWTLLSAGANCCELEGDHSWWLEGIGRLAPGVTIEQALADLQAIHAGLVPELGSSREIATPRLDPLHELLVADTGPMLWLLFGAVAILLMIACANIAGLMLARAARRGREMGVRAALGAGRARIIRQLLTESLLISVAGGAVGVLLGHLGMRRIMAALPLQAQGWVQIQADWRTFLFAIAVAGGTAILFGLAPALYATRSGPQGVLSDAGRGSAGKGRRRALGLLVTVEVALAVVLLVGAGMIGGAFRSLTERDLGFNEEAFVGSLTLPEATYPDADARRAFWERLDERIGALPGVELSGLTTLAPLSGHTGWFFDIEDGIELPEEESRPVVLTRFATPGYLEALGVEYLAGGPFEAVPPGEEEDPFGVVVNETFARTFWGRTDVLGKGVRNGDERPWLPIVGVIRDTRHYGPDRPMRPGVFMPFGVYGQPSLGTFALRSEARAADQLLPDVRAIVGELDSDLPLFRAGTLSEHLGEHLWAQRLYASLLAAFGALALVLALGGIYSTLSYVVSERRTEIGIRMALGARRAQVVREVVAAGMKVVAAGLVVGLGLAWLAAGAAASLLEGANPRDPALYAVVVALLGAAALGANLLPARRASRTEPASAIRTE